MMTAARNRYFERLTRKNAALLLVDHQIGLFTGIRDIDVAQLKHNVVALAKAATKRPHPISFGELAGFLRRKNFPPKRVSSSAGQI